MERLFGGNMVLAAFQILLEIFKVFWYIVKKWELWNAVERQLFTDRMAIVGKNLNVILTNQQDAFDEDSYMKGLEEDKKIRYEKYRDIIFSHLSLGHGINELSLDNKYYMGARIVKDRDNVLKILLSSVNITEKSRLIAKSISEILLET